MLFCASSEANRHRDVRLSLGKQKNSFGNRRQPRGLVYVPYLSSLLRRISNSSSSSAVAGTRDVYRNSFISPKSLAPEGEEAPPDGARTSGPQHLLTRRVESPPSTVDVERSAELRTAGVEDLLTFKNVADSLDSNDVEYSGRLSNFIQPSKTVSPPREENSPVGNDFSIFV